MAALDVAQPGGFDKGAADPAGGCPAPPGRLQAGGMEHADAAVFAAAAQAASRRSGHAMRLTGHVHHATHLQAGRFELDNGLKIILAQHTLAPIFAYQTWFRVGSKHEEPQRTGLAHLFEHLMFKGTSKHPTGTFDREMEQRGSQTNAATWVDWTYYTEALAVRGDNLQTVIDFEADRMVNLRLDEKTFRSELEVVKNERRMSVEDSVVGTLGERLMALAYTQHPYRWPTLGSMAHLEAASLADLQRFYATYYAPNNATVVLCGALPLEATLVQLAAAYGPLRAQPVHYPPKVQEPPQRAARRQHLQREVQAPHVLVGYHAPAQGDADFFAAEVLADVLAAGDTGRLYRELVTERQLASEVSASLSPFAEPGLLEIYLAARPGVSPDALLAGLQQTLAGVQAEIEPFEMNKARHGLELGQLDSLKSVEGCAEALGHYETNFADFAQALRLTAAYQAVQTEQVLTVAGRILQPDNSSVVIATPHAAAE